MCVLCVCRTNSLPMADLYEFQWTTILWGRIIIHVTYKSPAVSDISPDSCFKGASVFNIGTQSTGNILIDRSGHVSDIKQQRARLHPAKAFVTIEVPSVGSQSKSATGKRRKQYLNCENVKIYNHVCVQVRAHLQGCLYCCCCHTFFPCPLGSSAQYHHPQYDKAPTSHLSPLIPAFRP